MAVQNVATSETVAKALINRYIKTEGEAPNATADDLILILSQLPEELLAGDISLMRAIEAHKPGTVLPPRERSIIAAVDDCTKMVFAFADLEVEIEQQLRFAIPAIAKQVVKSPVTPLTEASSVLTILDQIVAAMIGWSSSLGRAGEKVYEKTLEVINALGTPDVDIKSLDQDVAEFFSKEQGRITKLEDRLSASETGQIRSQQAKISAASMIRG